MSRTSRIVGLVVVAALFAVVTVLALPADTAEAQPPEHSHILVLHPEVDPEMFDHGAIVGFHRCVDLANNRVLRLNAHHAHIHIGAAGAALFDRAGHGVVPAPPVGPPFAESCATFEAALPIPLPPPPPPPEE